MLHDDKEEKIKTEDYNKMHPNKIASKNDSEYEYKYE